MSKASDDNFCELHGIRKAARDAVKGTYSPPPRTDPEFFAGLRLPRTPEQKVLQERIQTMRYLRSLIAYRREFFLRAPTFLLPITEKDRIDPLLYGNACALVDISRETWEQPVPQVCFGPSPDWSRDRFRRRSYLTFMGGYDKSFDLMAPTLKKPLIGMLPAAAKGKAEEAA